MYMYCSFFQAKEATMDLHAELNLSAINQYNLGVQKIPKSYLLINNTAI